ncbi:alpha/beta fold hydrolase [Leptospira fluminis]|uniref:Alpha/beta fold hydrolase n=1 Tax=Leptospira fluminis TaxID=2484979 RepID=A0A4R9GLK0_9LEPT|nr:alpha/beta fold hydrolase [Leptospira fluminis]TGK14725.1 alpha/beta fold hydrolase [Leptospira fluminis]
MRLQVRLAFKLYPKKKDFSSSLSDPILILHGLFGSSKNWVTVSEYLSELTDVFSLDLRNHGDSPHSPIHTIKAMAEDVREFLEDQNLSSVILLGHSMGGLTAMKATLDIPGRISRLIVEDVAPRDYEFAYEGELSALKVDVTNARSRQEVDFKMTEFVPDPFIRNFLLMNLERREEGGYRWKLNVGGIENSKRMFDSQYTDEDRRYEGPTSFLIGGMSEYFRDTDRSLALKYFPKAEFYTIPQGDHYMHFTRAAEFKELVLRILSSPSFS